MESLGDVDRDVVYTVLHGALAQSGKHLGHLPAVAVGHLFGLKLQFTAVLQVDKQMWTGIVVQINLMSVVISMEDDDLVLVVA